MLFITGKYPIIKFSKYELKWLISYLFLQVSTLANEPWKENFSGTDFCQIDQNWRNSGKLVPQRFIYLQNWHKECFEINKFFTKHE